MTILQIDRERYKTPHEVAEITGYTYANIRRLIGAGYLALWLVADYVFVDMESVRQYVAGKPQRGVQGKKKPRAIKK